MRGRIPRNPWPRAWNSKGLVPISLFLMIALLMVGLLSAFSPITHAVGPGAFSPPKLNNSSIYSGAVPPPYYEVVATVTSMVDGDTTWVRIEDIVVELDPEGEVYEGNLEKVRYGGGIDAPETWTDPPEPGGHEATEFVENLIPVGTTVYLDLNDLSEGGQTGRPYRGTYERLIGVIYTVIDGQWINVNAELLKWGLEEYPDHEWLRYIYFPSEWDPYEWLEEDYPYVLDFVERRDIMVSILPDEKTGAPGGKVTFTVFVKNAGNVEDTYSLIAGDNAGWNLMLADDLIEHVAPGHVQETTLTVTIPEDAENRAEDSVTVTVTSQENTEVGDSATCTATAEAVSVVPGISVSITPSEGNGAPGETVTFAVTVTNTGVISDDYDLTATDDAGWGATLDDDIFENVAPDENRQTSVSVVVPGGAIEGESTVITVTATSQADSTVENSTVCTVGAEAAEVGDETSELPWVPVAGTVVVVVVIISVILVVRPF